METLRTRSLNWKLASLPLVGALFLFCHQPFARTHATTLPQVSQYGFNDSHVHLTNYIQEGTDIHDFLKIMGTKVGRVALLGIPLQQDWSYQNSGDFAPTYYLQSDTPLYYYSFTDAYIAMAYCSLSKEPQARFDPMITGFSWDEVAKYMVATPESARISADLINSYPDRFLFGTDEVAPKSQVQYLRVYDQYDPLWKSPSADISEKVRKGNYERLFDRARQQVRAWEQAHVK